MENVISAGLDKLLTYLDEDQREAVFAPRGPTVIIAGAGTGKTTTVTARIARSIGELGVNPQHILALTFTTKAAGELKSRIRSTVGAGVMAQTFHSAAFRQLKYFSALLEDYGSWQVLSHKSSYIKKIMYEMEVGKLCPLTVVQTEIERAKCSGVTPDKYEEFCRSASRDIDGDVAVIAQVYAGYEQQKKRDRLYDFDDLLMETIQIYQQYPQLCEVFRSQYRSFYVDEFQDVNLLQYTILSLWLGERDDITIVGDVNQTIYSFAGADFRYLLNFPQYYPQSHIVRLYRDYRSTVDITQLANAVMGELRNSAHSSHIQLQGQRKERQPPQCTGYATEEKETQGIVERCTTLIAQGIPPRDIAILYRLNSQSTAFEEALLNVGLPYRVRDGVSLLSYRSVQELIKRLQKIIHTQQYFTVEQLDKALYLSGYLPHPTQQERNDYHQQALTSMRALIISHMNNTTFAASDFVAFLEKQREMIRNDENYENNTITLSTIHAAKGLEWHNVFLPRLVEGTLPYCKAQAHLSLDAEDEERRLFYVAITRAKVGLYLSWSQRRYDNSSLQKKSRFLSALVSRR